MGQKVLEGSHLLKGEKSGGDIELAGRMVAWNTWSPVQVVLFYNPSADFNYGGDFLNA